MIYEIICKLQDKIYSDDSWLILVELDKIIAIIDEALDIVGKAFYENTERRNPETREIDKHKDIDGYVCELTDLINHRIGFVNGTGEALETKSWKTWRMKQIWLMKRYIK